MPESPLEFLAVCNNYVVMKNVTNVVHKFGGHLHCVPSVITATEHLERRKMDGVIIDMALEGSMQLLKFIRDGRSNRQSAIFVCVDHRKDTSAVLAAGANFVFYKPLVDATMLQILQAAAPMMEAERRRYFRYEVAALVSLSLAGTEHKVVLSNLSETGMAVRSLQAFAPNTSVDFAFELPRGPVIKGHGEIMWSNKAGHAGIKFSFLSEAGNRELPEWLASMMGIQPLKSRPHLRMSAKID